MLPFLLPSPLPSTGPTRVAHEDFFDDNESHVGTTKCASMYVAYAVCVILMLGVSSAAGPLGVTCLGGCNYLDANHQPEMLAHGKVAEAGIAGRAVISGAMLGVLAVVPLISS